MLAYLVVEDTTGSILLTRNGATKISKWHTDGQNVVDLQYVNRVAISQNKSLGRAISLYFQMFLRIFNSNSKIK